MDPQSKKLMYLASHRGTKELDLLIGGYMTANIDQMASDEKIHCERLLRESEPDLYDWLMGFVEPPVVYAQLIEKMRAFHAK